MSLKGESHLILRASLVAASGGILFGYDMGIVSGALLQLREKFTMSCLTQELVVSCLLIGAVVSSLLGGTVIDLFGRKLTMIVNCGVFAIGAVTLSFASSVAFLITGRILLGFAVGLSVVAECAYITEISSPEHRGKLVSLNEVAIAMGFLIAYLVNYLCILIPNGWRVMFGLSGIFALFQCLALFYVPKSPRFLVIKEREMEALNVLKRLRGNESAANEELFVLKHNLASEEKFGWRQLCSFKDNMHYRLLIGFGLVLFQQSSGLPSVLYYAPVILKDIGFTSDQSATLATIGAGVVKTVAVLVSLLLVDKIGRKKLLLTGSLIMALCLFTMAGLNHKIPNNTRDICSTKGGAIYTSSNMTDSITAFATVANKSLPFSASSVVSLTSMLFYTAAYSIGYGPVTWLILSEIFPSAIKGRSVALIGAANWSFNLLVSFTFLDYLDKVGIQWMFATYGIGCCIGVIFITLLVPETKGRCLEEINSTLSSLSLSQEIKRQFIEICCCSSCCDSIRRRENYEPLSHGIALEPITSSSNSLDSSNEQVI